MTVRVTDNVFDLALRERVIVILRGVATAHVVKITDIMAANDLHLLEITCNSLDVEESIRTLAQDHADQVLVGAGTAVSIPLARMAIDAGAKYVITPNLDEEVIQYCRERNIPIIPGVATPTEIMRAVKLGLKMIKLFPISALGGSAYIKLVRGPIEDVSIVATGGVSTDNAAEMLAAGANVVAIGGGVITSKLIEEGNWEEINQRLQTLAAIARKT